MTIQRLRKTLSYRDQGGLTLEDHTAHWEGFVWQAGPVVVTHMGAAWGRVQVWASSAVEGKRVIRHAGAIAGIDPDASPGEWFVQVAANPRYGRTGRMVPRPIKGGGIHVTKRPGPDGIPEVAVPD